MSIATEIERIQADRNTIRAKLVELGLVASSAKLNACAAAIADIINRGAVSLSVKEGETVTIPAGYHNGSGTVSGVAGGGSYRLQSKTATPTKSQQNVTPDAGYYGLSDVTVAAIPEIYQDVSDVTAAAADVLTGKVIVLADGTVTAGTMPNNGAVTKTLTAATISYTIPKGYHNGSGKVTITLESKTVTPTKSAQTITPTSGKLLEKVTVEAIPDKYQDVTPVTALAAQVLDGVTIVDAEGNVVPGTMPDNSVAGSTTTFLHPTTPSRVIEEGYHNGNETVMVRSQEQTVTPTKETQTLQDANSYFKKVVVNPIPHPYHDVSGVTARAQDVLETVKFVDDQGVLQSGTIETFDDPTGEMDGLTQTSVDFEPGYYWEGVTVTLTDDIEQALAAI